MTDWMLWRKCIAWSHKNLVPFHCVHRLRYSLNSVEFQLMEFLNSHLFDLLDCFLLFLVFAHLQNIQTSTTTICLFPFLTTLPALTNWAYIYHDISKGFWYLFPCFLYSFYLEITVSVVYKTNSLFFLSSIFAL